MYKCTSCEYEVNAAVDGMPLFIMRSVDFLSAESPRAQLWFNYKNSHLLSLAYAGRHACIHSCTRALCGAGIGCVVHKPPPVSLAMPYPYGSDLHKKFLAPAFQLASLRIIISVVCFLAYTFAKEHSYNTSIYSQTCPISTITLALCHWKCIKFKIFSSPLFSSRWRGLGERPWGDLRCHGQIIAGHRLPVVGSWHRWDQQATCTCASMSMHWCMCMYTWLLVMVDEHNTVNNTVKVGRGLYGVKGAYRRNPFPAFHGDKVGLNSQDGKPPSLLVNLPHPPL